MKIIFLDFDGVLNSAQSAQFWHSRRDQAAWEDAMYRDWPGTLKEYIAMEFCPIAFSNVEELVKRTGAKIVVSSTWRIGETVETLKEILKPSQIIASAVIGKTESFSNVRGNEIKKWVDSWNNMIKNDPITNYVIIDDDSDMLEEQKTSFVKTSSLHGFQFADMLKAEKILIK
jgi:hypothetical protein